MNPALVFFEPEAIGEATRAARLIGRLNDRTSQVYAVTRSVLKSLTQTENPQGIVAIYPLPDLPLPSAPGFVLVLDAIRDYGNVGAILRTAWAAGVDSVLLAPGTADMFNPKVVRAAMGAHFYLPIISQTWDEIARILKPIPRVYLADAHRGETYFSAAWTRPFALVVGGEAEGASPEAEEVATTHLTIPMAGNIESLNAAIAAGILIFEAIRKRDT